MDTKVVALICVSIIFIVAVTCILSVLTAKEDSRLVIVNNEKLYVGDSITVKLTTNNGNPISNETINIKLTDNEGTTINKKLTTDNNGETEFKIKNKGNYSVEATFNGNDKYLANSTSKNITVKKRVVKPKSKTINTHNQNSGLSEDGYSYYPEYGPAVDSLGYTREEAIAKNWHYIPQTIDGHDAGIYVPYDPVAGCYHT